MYASRSLIMFDPDLNAFSAANHAFSLLFSCLLPGQPFPSQSQLRDANEAAEKAMKRKASAFAAGLVVVSSAENSRLSAENERVTAKHSKVTAEHRKLTAEKKDLERQLHELKKQKS